MASFSFTCCTYHYCSLPFPSKFFNQNTSRTLKTRRTITTLSISSSTTATNEPESEPINVEVLHRFFDLTVGKWNGSFHQFDENGKLMQKVTTKLSASTYGEDDLMSLIQTLYIKQPSTTYSGSGYGEEEEWAEYKIKETNMFTVDKYQQSADWILPGREGICFEISNCWYVGNCVEARSARGRRHRRGVPQVRSV